MPSDNPTPLASRTDLSAYPILASLIGKWDTGVVDALMIRATRSIEARCNRRLAPFTATESHVASGIDAAGQAGAGWPLDLTASLGRSRGAAFGSQTSVRDVWLNEYAPRFSDLWVYSNVSVVLARAVGGTQAVGGATLEGPEPDTGHLRFQLGTWAPVGTTVRVAYSGGYQTTPASLVEAAIFQATKHVILATEPQTRQSMSLSELEAEISRLLAPFNRDNRSATNAKP